MARAPIQPEEVEVVFPGGKTLHFKTSLGDTIVLDKVNTAIKGPPDQPVLYYTLLITPCKGTES